MSRVDTLKFALATLRETIDLYVSDDVGMPELADAMDKAYAALYPPKGRDFVTSGGRTPIPLRSRRR